MKDTSVAQNALFEHSCVKSSALFLNFDLLKKWKIRKQYKCRILLHFANTWKHYFPSKMNYGTHLDLSHVIIVARFGGDRS